MKKTLIVILFALFGCSYKRGEIINEPIDFIMVNNKIYKLTKIVPCKNCDGIWIMYPKDSTVAQPLIINYNKKSGNKNENQTIIKIE